MDIPWKRHVIDLFITSGFEEEKSIKIRFLNPIPRAPTNVLIENLGVKVLEVKLEWDQITDEENNSFKINPHDCSKTVVTFHRHITILWRVI